MLFFMTSLNYAQAPNLGTASTFALFTSAGAFNNTGASIITGDIGTNVGVFSGFPPGIVFGQTHVADAVSAVVAADVQLAYNSLAGVTCGVVLGVGLGNNQTLAPNVYCIGGAATLNGNLVLDGQNNPNALFIFQINGALATGTFASVTLINGASLCNVYWQINGEFDLNNGSVFRGTLLVNGAMHFLGNGSLLGRALSRAGAVSTESNIITIGLPPVPATIIASGPTTFCAGGSVILSGNNNGGTWNTGATTPTITVTLPGDYFVTTTNGCGSAVSNHIIVTVNPIPNANPVTNQILCNGMLTAPVTFSGSVPGTIFNWVNNTPGIGLGASGTGNIPSFIGINNGISPLIATITVTPSFTSSGVTCLGTPVTFTITVNNNLAPNVNPVPNQTYCVGSTVPSIVFTSTSPGATFTWTRTPEAIGALPLNGTGPVPSFITTNTGTAPLTATFTVMASLGAGGGNCAGSSPISFTITVNPSPSVNTVASQTYCVGATVPSIVFTSPNTGGTIVYNWTRTPAAIGLAALSGTGPVPSFIAANPGTTPLVSTFSVNSSFTLNGVTCSGPTIQFTITINPGPQINALPNISTCANTLTGPINFSSTVAGTIFNWTNSDPTIGLGASGTGNIPQFTAINLGPGIKIATITVTPSFVNGGVTCPGAPVTFTITISPPPVAICKNATLILNAAGVATLNPPDINNGSTGGIVTISKTSFNCSNVGVNTVILTVTDACGKTATCAAIVTVIDNLPPVLSMPPNITIQCDQAIPPVPIVTATDNCSAVINFTQVNNQSPWLQLCEHFTYTIVRTWIATDPSGNTAIKVQIIYVQDTTPPVLTMLPVANAFADCDEAQVHGCPIPIDNCDQTPSLLFSFHYEPYIGGCANSYTVVRKWIAGDKCGNTSFATQNVYVVDKGQPELTCPANIEKISNVPVAVTWPMPKAWDDCDGTLIAVQTKGPKNGSLFDPGTVTTIEFKATDNCGNVSICSFTVTISKGTIINQGAKISGEIKNMNGGLIENAEVNIKGNINQFQASTLGKYEFTGLTKGSNEVLSVSKLEHPLEGVNTLDLVYITNHILGKKALDSPFKILAADVTNNGSVTTADLVELRKLVLHIIDKFENIDSWEFFPSSISFQNPFNPWKDPIVSTIKLDNIQTDQTANLIGIKIGDVNWDATGNANGSKLEVKSNETFHLQADNKFFSKGDLIEFKVSGNEISKIKGLQFTLDYDTNILEFVNSKANRDDIGEGNFGLRYINDGKITGSIDLSKGVGDDLFSFVFKALEPGELRKSLNLSSSITNAEAYNQEDETIGLNLLFKQEGKIVNIEAPVLYQNEPNPFESYTDIRFALVQDQEATLSILDLNGKLIYEVKDVYLAGEHKINLEKSIFPAPGVYYYQLKTSSINNVKKMMYIK